MMAAGYDNHQPNPPEVKRHCAGEKIHAHAPKRRKTLTARCASRRRPIAFWSRIDRWVFAMLLLAILAGSNRSCISLRKRLNVGRE
jgi:hypothetical protein